MRERLNKLKKTDATDKAMKQATDAEIAERLRKIKGEMPITSDDELHARLAKLRGVPIIESKVLFTFKKKLKVCPLQLYHTCETSNCPQLLLSNRLNLAQEPTNPTMI